MWTSRKVELLIRQIVQFKIYVQRAQAMLAIGNSGLLLYLVFRDQGLPWWAVVLGFMGAVLTMALWGWIEYKIGSLDYEQKFWSERNPQMQELLKIVGEIRAKLP